MCSLNAAGGGSFGRRSEPNTTATLVSDLWSVSRKNHPSNHCLRRLLGEGCGSNGRKAAAAKTRWFAARLERLLDAERGACEAVVLGCTELSMLLDDATLPLLHAGLLLDTASVHAQAAVRFALAADDHAPDASAELQRF